MPRDNLFAQQANPRPEGSSAPFTSAEDLNVARALTDVLLNQRHDAKLTSLSSLQSLFARAEAEPAFTAWVQGNMNAVVPEETLARALGPELLQAVQQQSGVPQELFLRRLAYVFPMFVREVSSQELADSARAFRFNLSELRRRLASAAAK